MRNNQPVTQREVPLPSDHTLMSTTDPQGQITYANSHFVQISGFSAEELLGSPHNLVRHPDMPAPAFGDMWKTIQGGQPWSAVVKNRCKSGDHYWVRANVCPVFKQGRLVGHISVRTAPSRQEAAACEKLYGDLREGRAGNTHLHKGIVVQGGWRWLWSAWLLLGVRARLRWSCGLLWLAWALCSHFVLQLSQGQMLQSMGLSAVLTFITYAFLAHEIATPVETLQQQALDIVTGRTREEVHLERVDEVGMTLRTVNQLGMMFRWLIDDVTSQAVQLQTGVSEIAQGSMTMAFDNSQPFFKWASECFSIDDGTGPSGYQWKYACRGGAPFGNVTAYLVRYPGGTTCDGAGLPIALSGPFTSSCLPFHLQYDAAPVFGRSGYRVFVDEDRKSVV